MDLTENATRTDRPRPRLLRPKQMRSALTVVVVSLSSLAVAQSAFADDPQPTVASAPTKDATGRPSQAPPEAINCVMPDAAQRIPSLASNGAFVARVETDGVRLDLPSPGAGATCYAVFRSPAGPNPVSFAWDPNGVEGARSVPDEVPLLFSGTYCYKLYFGSSAGVADPLESCLEIPESLAPAPKPTPSPAFRPPPGVGAPETGEGPLQPTGSTSSALALGLGGALAGLGAAGVLATRKRRS